MSGRILFLEVILSGTPAQTVSNLVMIRFIIFDFIVMSKQYVLSRNQTLSFKFGSFPGLMICGMALPCDAGLWQQAAAGHEEETLSVLYDALCC